MSEQHPKPSGNLLERIADYGWESQKPGAIMRAASDSVGNSYATENQRKSAQRTRGGFGALFEVCSAGELALRMEQIYQTKAQQKITAGEAVQVGVLVVGMYMLQRMLVRGGLEYQRKLRDKYRK